MGLLNGVLVGKSQPFLRAILGQVRGGEGDDTRGKSLSSTARVGR